MSTIRKSIATASVAVLALGVSFAATTTPAAAVVEDGAGPLSWTYDVATGTYEHPHAQAKQVKSNACQPMQTASNFPKLDSTSKLAYNNPEG